MLSRCSRWLGGLLAAFTLLCAGCTGDSALQQETQGATRSPRPASGRPIDAGLWDGTVVATDASSSDAGGSSDADSRPDAMVSGDAASSSDAQTAADATASDASSAQDAGPSCSISPEVCDGLDNDCDSRIDEELTQPCGTAVGSCSPGVRVCSAGSWGACQGGVSPVRERCDGLDNDCDGQADEALVRACGAGTPSCGGAQVCSSGRWGACMATGQATPEVCDGLDNNCDGRVDNGAERACPAPPQASAVCAGGRCDFLCMTGWANCNLRQADGCEVNLMTDPRRCGGCTSACPTGPNAVPTCNAQRCGIRCIPPYRDCDGDPRNGCEKSLADGPC